MIPFNTYCHRVLPAVFDDSLSYYEVLCKLTDRLCRYMQATNADIDEIQVAINELHDYVHGTAWEDAIRDWICENLPCIVAQTCKWFHFGINDDGNVVCTIPLSWQDFDIHWNYDYGSPDFGRLTIGWNTNG